MPDYAYCETIAAYVWHIRKLTTKGLKPGGGADTRALCGAEALWDIANVEVFPNNPAWRNACRKCKAEFEAHPKEAPDAAH